MTNYATAVRSMLLLFFNIVLKGTGCFLEVCTKSHVLLTVKTQNHHRLQCNVLIVEVLGKSAFLLFSTLDYYFEVI